MWEELTTRQAASVEKSMILFMEGHHQIRRFSNWMLWSGMRRGNQSTRMFRGRTCQPANSIQRRWTTIILISECGTETLTHEMIYPWIRRWYTSLTQKVDDCRHMAIITLLVWCPTCRQVMSSFIMGMGRLETSQFNDQCNRFISHHKCHLKLRPLFVCQTSIRQALWTSRASTHKLIKVQSSPTIHHRTHPQWHKRSSSNLLQATATLVSTSSETLMTHSVEVTSNNHSLHSSNSHLSHNHSQTIVVLQVVSQCLTFITTLWAWGTWVLRTGLSRSERPKHWWTCTQSLAYERPSSTPSDLRKVSSCSETACLALHSSTPARTPSWTRRYHDVQSSRSNPWMLQLSMLKVLSHRMVESLGWAKESIELSNLRWDSQTLGKLTKRHSRILWSRTEWKEGQCLVGRVTHDLPWARAH